MVLDSVATQTAGVGISGGLHLPMKVPLQWPTLTMITQTGLLSSPM